MTNYTAIFQKAQDGTIWGWVPEIPGAPGIGNTIDEAAANLKAGLEVWVESERELGHEIPPPAVLGTRVVVIDAA